MKTFSGFLSDFNHNDREGRTQRMLRVNCRNTVKVLDEKKNPHTSSPIFSLKCESTVVIFGLKDVIKSSHFRSISVRFILLQAHDYLLVIERGRCEGRCLGGGRKNAQLGEGEGGESAIFMKTGVITRHVNNEIKSSIKQFISSNSWNKTIWNETITQKNSGFFQPQPSIIGTKITHFQLIKSYFDQQNLN
jgi:hypothetical protein